MLVDNRDDDIDVDAVMEAAKATNDIIDDVLNEEEPINKGTIQWTSTCHIVSMDVDSSNVSSTASDSTQINDDHFYESYMMHVESQFLSGESDSSLGNNNNPDTSNLLNLQINKIV